MAVVLIYVDSIVIFPKTPGEYIATTKMVLTAFKGADVALVLKGVPSFTNWINYLGDIIIPGGLEVANYTADAIGKLKLPKKVTELRSFSGLRRLFKRLLPILQQFGAAFQTTEKSGESHFRPLHKKELDSLDIL